jgi:hypothetical protein
MRLYTSDDLSPRPLGRARDPSGECALMLRNCAEILAVHMVYVSKWNSTVMNRRLKLVFLSSIRLCFAG